MIQDSEMLSWNQILVYSIEKDQSAEYDTWKILFHSNQIKLQLSNDLTASTYGLYGIQESIENQINTVYPEMEKFSFQQELINNEKGVIVFVYQKTIIIPCLLFPKQYFFQKPIDEKSIQLTLFRILTDLTSTIIMCFDEQIYCDWYLGDRIPFSDQHSTSMLKFIIEQNKEEKLQTTEVGLASLIPQGQLNWKILPPTNNQTTFLIYQQIQFTNQDEKELKLSLEKINIQMIQNIFITSDSQMSTNVRNHLRQEFQSLTVIEKLSELQQKYFKQINQLWDEICKTLRQKIYQKNIQRQDEILQFLINRLKKLLIITKTQNFGFDYTKDEFPHTYEKISIYSLIGDYGQAKISIELKLNDLLYKTISQAIPHIIEEHKKKHINENNIVCYRSKFTAIRSTDKENTVEKISMTINSQFIIDGSQLTKGLLENIKQKLFTEHPVKLIDLFITTQGQPDILIAERDKKILVVSLPNDGQIKIIRYIENIPLPLFLFNQQQKILYGFNHDSRSSVKLPFNEMWKIDGEKIFYDSQAFLLSKVIYLTCSETFIGLNMIGNVSKWNGKSDQFTKIKSSTFDSNKNERMSKDFQPSFASGTKYNQLEACPSGKRFFLSNSHVIDIYDECFELTNSIQLQGRFIIFTDKSDAFLVGLDELKWKNQIKSALMIRNLSNQQQIKQMNQDELQEKKVGNPCLDILRGSQVKYGPIQTFLLNNQSKINFLIVNSNNRIDQITKYLKKIQINENFEFYFPNDAQLSGAMNQNTQSINSFFLFTYTRIPLQLCTIENNQLTPLIDGFRQQINCNQSLTIPQRAKLLKLGYIEDYLMNLDEKIFVVSIIGRQSSGKSYLLNRLFGTRFSVAASRCTDGIWASMTQIYDSKFLILDCEGLFSTQRTKNEETQLLAFLASVCDVTILNQDLSFNRYLDELLDNLTSATGKLTGDSLFKGTLLIALRDISLKDSEGAKDQLLKNIKTNLESRNSSFLDTLFNRSFNAYFFSYFEYQKFPEEVEKLRENFLSMAIESSRWSNGRDLIQTIKILLIQLETADAENTDQLHFKFQIEEILEKLQKQWAYLDCDQKLLFQNKEYPHKNYQLWSENIENNDRQQFCENLITQIKRDLEFNNTIDQHNINQLVIQEFLNELLSSRKSYLQNQFEKEILNMKNGQLDNEIVKLQKIVLIRYIEEQERFYKLCSMQCSKCFLNCSKFQNHSNYFQIEINQNDNQLQNLLKKYESKSIDFNENQKQIDECKEQEQQLSQDIDVSNGCICYYEHLKTLITIKTQLTEVQDQILKNQIIEKTNLYEANFIKLLHMYGDLNKYRLEEEEQIILEGKDNEILLENHLQEFMNSRKLILTSQNQTLQHSLLCLCSQQKELQCKLNQLEFQQKTQVCEKNKNNQLIKDQERIILDLSSQSELPEKLIIDLTLQIDKLEQQLKQLKQLHNFEFQIQSKSNANFFLNKQKELKIILQENDQTLQSLRDNISQRKQVQQNSQLELQKQVDVEIYQVNQIADFDFLEKSKSEVNNYQTLNNQDQQLDQEIKLINLSSKKNFSYECQLIGHKIKTVNLKEYSSFQKVKEILEEKKQLNYQLILSLHENDIDLKQKILEQDQYNQQNSSQFKQNYIQQKLENLQASIELENSQKEENLRQLENDIVFLERQQETHQILLQYCNSKILLYQEINKKTDLEKQIVQMKNQIVSTAEIQNKISKQIQQLDFEAGQIKTELSQRQSELKLLTQQIEVNQKSIRKIEEITDQYNDFKGLIMKYESLCKEQEALMEILSKLDKSQFDLFDEDNLNQEAVQKKIEERNHKIEWQKQQFQQKSEEIENLLYVQNDFSKILKLKQGLSKLKIQEKEQHSCLRLSHQCDQECEVCKDTQCQKQAGHQQHHLCDLPKHYCKEGCQIEGCSKNCTFLYLHEGQHNCGSLHSCKILCQYCGGDCQYDFTAEHPEHICRMPGCIQKCSLCGRSCKHDHRHSRIEGQVHFCENQHSCDNFCTTPGVCVWEYKEEKREWKSALSSFTYSYFKQIDGGKQKCTIQIDSGKILHENIHSCKVETHRCGTKCPECDGLCTKEYGHVGFHFAKQHRNKDCQIFTLAVGQGMEVELKENLETHKYQVGENSSPETCSQSCARRSRAHFHLIRCQGEDYCLGKKNKFARHQKSQYQGFEEIEFDEIQCVEFWKLQSWEHPLSVGDGDALADIQACNYYCPFCSETNKKFCSEPAWHTDSNQYQKHKFWCKTDHQSDFEFVGLDVVFVIDATGSMSHYIEQAKQMIKNIMGKAKLKAEKNLRFGIVAFRDHDPQEKSFVTDKQELGSEIEALKYLEKLTAKGGGDYPEAVLDGLQASLNFSWEKNHDKMIFLIGDAPPHGKKYSNKSYWPNGCPCGIKEEDLFKKMKDLQIKFKILELNEGLNLMIREFKKFIDCEVLQKSSKFDFVTQVVQKVCNQIEMREITYRKD